MALMLPAGMRAAEPGDAAAAGCAARPGPALAWAAAERRLLDCNPDLRIAVRTIDAARADVLIAGQRPNPTLSLGAEGISPSAGIGAGGPLDKQIDFSARLDQTFERGGKRDLRLGAAGQAQAAARWEAADTLRQSLLSLADAWIDLWGAQQRVDLQQQLLALYQRTLDGAQRRLQAGDIARADVSRIALDRTHAEADRQAALAALGQTRQALAALLAIDGDPGTIEAQAPWPALPPDDEPLRMPADAPEQRPDLMAAQAQAAAAAARGRLARSQQSRDLTVGVQTDRYPHPAGNGWTFGVFVSVPLHLSHRYEGEIARARADQDVAELTVARLTQQALAERRRLLEARMAARARLDRLQRDALPLARQVANDAETAWRKGAGSVLELLDALRQLKSLELAALDARLDDDHADAAARAAMLSAASAHDPVFGKTLATPPADHPSRHGLSLQ